jgi:hypothetical protein
MKGCRCDLTDCVSVFRPEGEVCSSCADALATLSRELPLTIQEFHAWALMLTECVDYSTCEKYHPPYAAARDRVVRLRALEAKLKGEG